MPTITIIKRGLFALQENMAGITILETSKALHLARQKRVIITLRLSACSRDAKNVALFGGSQKSKRARCQWV